MSSLIHVYVLILALSKIKAELYGLGTVVVTMRMRIILLLWRVQMYTKWCAMNGISRRSGKRKDELSVQ